MKTIGEMQVNAAYAVERLLRLTIETCHDHGEELGIQHMATLSKVAQELAGMLVDLGKPVCEYVKCDEKKDTEG